MSENKKFVARPKVRFSQTDAEELVTGGLKNSNDQKNVKQSSTPRITSIVALVKPVRLVNLKGTRANCEDKDSKVIDNTQNANSSTLCANTLPTCTIQSSSSLNKNSVKTENHIPLNDANNIQNIKKNVKEIDTPQTSAKSINDDITVPTASSIKQSENVHKILKPKNYVTTNPLKRDSTKSKKGKENDAVIVKKGIKTATIKCSDADILKHKARICSAGTSTKKPIVANKTSISGTTKKNVNSKSAVGIMPCYKHKTMIRDIIGSKIKPCIGPGVSHTKLDDLKILKTDESTHVKSIVSGEILGRPEYNSIMCTINKLNEIKKQKVVTDVEHLPAAYKNVISGKVSTALDFPLDEAIYKNLVDLSIDENQLPNRLTRSKDPEPRQKDIVPVLSDFFTPAPTEEYCTAVSTKPRTPEIVDTSNPFRISDQICKWKYRLDNA
ncbi:PREDICTED: uncharacterized protein LOC108570611 [Habropoda laboriosa]|uniref:uncharacterized protein LOC108570611 n=1 Tax=Habropoda laboriosa TaxID=597456 RepID=UPI00083E316A|nr:PREDICTED: uncharacterized protein LOC108570611 [Habropoda laboriosa]